MEEVVTRQHAHINTVYHCLYGYYSLGFSRQHLAVVYNKSERTIGNWIRVYEETGEYRRATAKVEPKFTAEHRQWLFIFYQEHPLAYIDEAQAMFKRAHRKEISKSSIWRILHELGFTWKVLERRAIHIKERDVFRFVEELSHIDWSHHNLVFLDEVSFDNRGMVRRRGYAIRGKKVLIRGDMVRKPRVSVLAFIGINGVLDYFDTDGTFDRAQFADCCQDFVHSARGQVRQYPGSNSVWILDGATIHRDPEIVHYIRSVGVVPIFLPAYCPFFNPIEFLFGYMKKSFRRYYNESSERDLLPFIVQTFRRFDSFNMNKIFHHCGWTVQGVFDPTRPLSSDSQNDINASGSATNSIDELGFTRLSQ